MLPTGALSTTPYRFVDDENQTRADTIELLFLRKLDTPTNSIPFPVGTGRDLSLQHLHASFSGENLTFSSSNPSIISIRAPWQYAVLLAIMSTADPWGLFYVRRPGA